PKSSCWPRVQSARKSPLTKSCWAAVCFGQTVLGPLIARSLVVTVYAALHESAFGTKRTFRGLVPMSAFGGKADIVRKSQNVRLKPGPRAQFMGEAVGAALLALATLRLWGLHEYVHEVGLQPSHLTRHPVLTGSELQDDLLQSGQT